ncbi:MAG TPA: YceI family protein, partial [Fibrobacteria bacterium]|nr:YceI family protein [Fibrobacteria bacterium]
MKIQSLLAFALAAVATQAQTWKLDPAHSSVDFSIKHFGISNVKGGFDKLDGSVTGDPKTPTSLVPEITIQATSVNTNAEKRDEHLRTPDFFDVAKFPTITFKSEKTEVRGGKLFLEGTLTLHGVSKKVEIPYEANGPVVDPYKNTRIGLEGSFTLKR